MEVRREILVVLAADADFSAVVEKLRRVAPVTQALPPRLVLVALPPGVADPDVAGIRSYHDAPAAAALQGMTEQERLFVSAWAARHVGKARQGDAQPWDADGRQPPDPPVHGLG